MTAPVPAGDDITAVLAAQQMHTFRDQHTCRCGYAPADGADWNRHLTEVALVELVRRGWQPPAGDVLMEWGVKRDGSEYVHYRASRKGALTFAERFGGTAVGRPWLPWTPISDQSGERHD